MSTVRLAAAVALLSCVYGFAPSSRYNARRGSSLSMSAALIVQNKGGGHGELGTLLLLLLLLCGLMLLESISTHQNSCHYSTPFSFIGYQLAKNLSSNPKITSITILQDDACKDDQEPFKSYASDLPDVKVVKAPLGDESMTCDKIQSLLGEGESYDYVWDNASKSPKGAGKAVPDLCKEWGVKLLTYVSSAGMYTPSDDTVFPMAETTAIKESAGQALYDQYCVDLGLPLVSFRPQV
jgi:hypothetical protein